MATGVKSKVAVLVTPFIVACAGSGGGSSEFDSFSIRYREDARGYHYTFAAPADQVLQALPDVYQYFGFPGALASDTDQLVFISPAATAQGRIYQEEPNSLYLDCGTLLDGPRADTHLVQFAIMTRIVPLEAGGSEIEIIIDGLARARDHNINPVPCRGTGKLEGQIATVLRSRLAG